LHLQTSSSYDPHCVQQRHAFRRPPPTVYPHNMARIDGDLLLYGARTIRSMIVVDLLSISCGWRSTTTSACQEASTIECSFSTCGIGSDTQTFGAFGEFGAILWILGLSHCTAVQMFKMKLDREYLLTAAPRSVAQKCRGKGHSTP